MTLKTIDTELQALQDKQAQLEAEKVASAGDGDFSTVATLKAQLEHVSGLVRDLLNRRKAAQEQAEIEAKFADYEQLSKDAVKHFQQVKAIDDTIANMQTRLAELIAERSALDTDYHVPKHKRIQLFVELNRIDKERVNKLNKKYQVQGYM